MEARPGTDRPLPIAARMSRRRVLTLAAAATAAAAVAPSISAASQATPVTTTPVSALPVPATIAADASPEFRAVTDAVAQAMQRHRVPGVALGILAGDREEHATLGIASANTLSPVTAETLFQIGSLTKTFTGTAIWRLNDLGALAVDAPVTSVIPDLRTADPSVAAAVKITNLLDHSAGWYGDEGFETGTGDDALARYVRERLPTLSQLFPVGAYFSYNNAAFSLLGRLIEVTTGTTYNAAMEREILGPLGLEDSILDHAEVLQRPYADGHYAGTVNGRDVVAVQTPLWVPRSVDPAGGIWSTTRDILRYARFHLAATAKTPASSGAVVSAESLLRMREPAIDVAGLPLSMGQDWFVQDVDGVRIFSHNGDTAAQHAEFFAIPDHDFAFVLLTNGTGGTAAALEAVEAALASYPGLSGLAGRVGITRVGLAPAGTTPVELPPATLAEYAGTYADEGTIYHVAVKDTGLELASEAVETPGTWQIALAQDPSPFPISFAAKDEGLAAGVSRVPFVRNDAGKVGWMMLGLRMIPHVD